MVLPVLVGGAITAMVWAALNPSDSGDGFVSGKGRVKAAGNDDPNECEASDLSCHVP